jgi:hypothetical protein
LIFSNEGKAPYIWDLIIHIQTKGELIRVQSKNHEINFEKKTASSGIVTLNELDR